MTRAAWRGVLSVAVTETVSWGVLYYSFSIFIGFLQRGAQLGSRTAAPDGHRVGRDA